MAKFRCRFNTPDLLWLALLVMALAAVTLTTVAMFMPLTTAMGGLNSGTGTPKPSIIDFIQRYLDMLWTWLGTWISGVGSAPRLPQFNGGGMGDLVVNVLIAIAGLQAVVQCRLWLGGWLPWLRPYDGSIPMVHRALMAAIEDRLPLNNVLENLIVHLPCITGDRLRVALQSGHSNPFDTLVEARLLTRDQAAAGHIAQLSGSNSWRAWVATLAENNGFQFARLRALTLLGTAIIGAFSLFVTLVIAPKFASIAMDQGISLDPSLNYMCHHPYHLPIGTLLLWVMINIGGVIFGSWLQRRRKAVLAGTILLQAQQRGEPESDIAHHLAHILPKRKTDLLRAGTQGAFGDLLHHCGWSGETLLTLADRLNRTESRLNALDRLRLNGQQLLTTLTLALPVYLLTDALFTFLITLMKHLA